MRHLSRSLAVILLSILLTGCGAYTGFKSFFVTGVALDTVGEQFVAISTQIHTGCTNLVIPATTCAKYRAFQVRFKQTYPLAVGVWEAAHKANDTATKDKAEGVIRGLATDLSNLVAEALASFATQEGK